MQITNSPRVATINVLARATQIANLKVKMLQEQS